MTTPSPSKAHQKPPLSVQNSNTGPLHSTPYEIRILQALRRIIRAVDLHSRRLSFQHKVTAPQLVCLLFIKRHPGSTLSSVSKGVHLSPSTVVGILDRLELKGWTKRERDKQDRRIVRTKITTKGRELLKKVPSPLQDKLAEYLKTLPELEQATIALSLEKITIMMEADDLDAAPILETGSVKTPQFQELPGKIIPLDSETGPATISPTLPEDANFHFDIPKVKDAPLVEQLVRSSPPLDPNSTYLYLLLFEHFANTCVIARSGEHVLGFVTGYRLPERPETLFVWQVGVRGDLRGRNLGHKMLLEILHRPESQGINSLETTVNPSNRASRRMFEKFAQELGSPLFQSLLFPQTLFGKTKHEEEILFHIGPLPALPQSNSNKEKS